MEKFKHTLKSPYILLGVLILVTGLILYSEFIFGDKILAYNDWGYDTRHSYLPSYEAFIRGLKNHHIEFYDFSYGLGTTWAARMMLILDPFAIITAILCAVFPGLSMGYMLAYMQFFKILLGGELCLVFLRQLKCSSKSSILSAYIFSFCGYMIATGQHYMFASFCVLAIMLLVSVNRYMEKGKCFLLIFSSAIIANVGPYAAFPIYVMAAVYVCVCIMIKEKYSYISKFKDILKTGFLIIIGLLISAYSFMLQAYEILKISSRIDDSSLIDKIKNSFYWVPFGYIKTGILRFFSNNLEGTVNNWKGVERHYSALPYFFSTLFILCVGQFLYNTLFLKTEKKKKKLVLFTLAIFLFSICNAFISLFFNIFSDLEYRYVFIWLPFFALLMAYALDQMFISNKFSHATNLLITIISFLCVSILVNDMDQAIVQSQYNALISLSACAIILDVYAARKRPGKIKDQLTYSFLFIVVAIELLIDNRMVLYADRSIMTKEQYQTSYWDQNAQDLIKYIDETEGDNFIRVDRTYLGYEGSPDVMYSALVPYRSVSIYNSMLSSYLTEFVQKFFPENLFSIQVAYNLHNYGLPFDTVVASNLGIKYVITDQERDIAGWTLVQRKNNRYLYKNESLNSAGLLYQNVINETSFSNMSLPEKKYTLSKAIVLADNNDEIISDKEDIFYRINEGAITEICRENNLESGTTIEILFDNAKINKKNQKSMLWAKLMSSVMYR